MFSIIFGKKESRKLVSTIDTIRDERDASEDEARKLRAKVADLKHEQKITEEDIKHMVRIREEKLDLDFEKKNLERERIQQEKIASVKDGYRDKMEERLQVEVKNIKEMYSEILLRLPTVSVKQMNRTSE